MGGVGGVGGSDSVPSIFPEEAVEVPEVEGGGPAGGITIDPEPEFLEIGTVGRAGVELPEGQFSLFEWSQIISEVIQKLREALTESELLDAEISKRFHEAVLKDAVSLLELYKTTVAQVDAWNELIGADAIQATFLSLQALTNQLNNLLDLTAQNDLTEIQDVNEAIQTLNDPVALQSVVGAIFGGDEVAARDFLIQKVVNYNNYLASRPDFNTPLQELFDLIVEYNSLLDDLEEAITTVNDEREELELSPLDPTTFTRTPLPSSDIQNYLAYEGTLEEIELEITPNANANLNLEAIYTDPLTLPRTFALQVAMLARATSPTEESWVGQAIAFAQSGGPYDSEGEFFIVVRDRYSVFFTDPNDGILQFIDALNDIPVPLIAIPLPTNSEKRVASYKTGVDTVSIEALRLAMKDQVAGAVEVQKVDDAIAEALLEGPFATAGEFYKVVRNKYAVKFASPIDGINLFKQAILEIPLLEEIPEPNLTTDLTLIPDPEELGEIPVANIGDAIKVIWLAGAESTLLAITTLNGIFELSAALLEEEKAFYLVLGVNILLPSAIVESATRFFLEGIAGIGSGAGLGGFALGLHSRVIEIALSSAILRGISTNLRLPISGREFARLQFTAMELLYRSSLLSSLPAARYLVSRLGTLSAASPAIAVAIAEAIIIQMGGIVSSGILRSIVNANFNRRFRRLGLLSIGGLARFTRAVSATLSLSILSVALAQLGRRIGMPGLVAQLFAHGAGIPTIDLLVALTAGSRLLDVLDNPISVLFLKQTLTDILVFRRGFSSLSVGLQINSAINSIILRGGFHTFSHLRAELINEFQRAGFSFFQANLLANETVALIRGDLGVQFLNVAFGLNFDRSVIASSIVNNIFGIDIGIASAMLSNAVTRSLLHGGFGSRVRLQNELMEHFQGFGLSRGDALAIALQTIDFIETIGILVPLNRSPDVINLLLGEPVLRAIAFGSGLIREELIEDLENRGLTNTQAELMADQLLSLAARTFVRPGNLFERTIEEAILRSVSDQIFQTQREFRDRIFGELRAVGFSRNAASFLANSVANFGLTGTNISIFGVSAARIEALNQATSTRLSEELGISKTMAQGIVDDAIRRAILRAPFSSEDQFKAVLREEIQREVINRLGRFDGYIIFDRAVADLATPNTILSLAALTEQLSAHLLGVLRPDLGARLAEEIKNQILVSILGGSTIDKIEDVEQRDPLSVLNQVNTQTNRLLEIEGKEEYIKMLRKLIQLLQALLTPNAEIGFLLQSLMDNPSTFIGSLLVQKPKGEFLDIPI